MSNHARTLLTAALLAASSPLALAPLPALAQTAPAAASAPAPATGRDRLIAWLTDLARQQTAERRAAIAALTTEADARQRQVRVRSLLSEMVEFESAAGPVVSESAGVSHEDGFDVERVRYQSLPGYWVTANVFTPKTEGPHPAIIIQPGHGVDGKLGNFSFAANFARAGFVVLNMDIVGEGERIQHFDPEIGSSKVGRPTGEHSMAFEQALPIGGHVSRYFLQDAMRGVDYLMARPDVDDQKIGAFGCSGGGTMTAYLAAIDQRIKATATACYVTDFDHLLAPGVTGPQDAEQSIPFFIERGLDLADWVEAAAPRPYAVVSTTSDMFPIDGARASYAEAKRFYGLMGAEDRITMIEGPGGHGNLGPISPQIVAFFTKYLMDSPAERPFTPTPLGDAARLMVTPTGQLSTSNVGLSLQQVIAADAPAAPAPVAGETPAQTLARLRVAIADIARTGVKPGRAAPAAAPGAAGALTFEMAPGMEVRATFTAGSGTGRRPTLLLLAPAANPALVNAYTTGGWNVLWLEPRGAGGTEEAKSPLTGDWTLLSLRALLVGKTPVGMRTDDAVAAMNWLAGQAEVDPARIDVMGVGALGPVALHAAVLDDRIRGVTADGSVTSYREFVERPISLNMAEVNLPGVLRRYDLPDLMAVLGDRLTLVNPVSSIGDTLTAAEVAARAPKAVVVLRGARDPVAPPPAR
ncbi:MAG: alpha/beta hydrolase [Caulobacteraceae bacterium]|nr:alpha/beta hydrolase [Caulobacteraceae bacterium]